MQLANQANKLVHMHMQKQGFKTVVFKPMGDLMTTTIIYSISSTVMTEDSGLQYNLLANQICGWVLKSKKVL